jgi:hypothetical protein
MIIPRSSRRMAKKVSSALDEEMLFAACDIIVYITCY